MSLSIEQQKHIEAWQASGLTQVGYCREQGLNVKNFGRWLRNYLAGGAAGAPRMIPVKVKPVLRAIQLRSPQGYVVEIAGGVSPRWLGELVKCLD